MHKKTSERGKTYIEVIKDVNVPAVHAFGSSQQFTITHSMT